MTLFDVYPLNNIVITRAHGSYVWDNNNNRYLDMYGGHAVISVGHNHPYWAEAIKGQMDKISFYSNSVIMPIQIELAEKLSKLSGKKEYQLFLCNSGAEANENAIKLASFYNGRKKVIAFSKSFHGRTSLAVAVTDNKSIVAPVNETENIIFLPFNDEAALQQIFDEQGSEISSVIIEGIQGVGGINVANNSFLQLLRKLCTQHNAVYIADSVQCGYGRTGKFFAHDYAGVDADIYSMAKGMGNGFPVGGILIAPFIKPKHGMLGTTFGGNPLACAGAIAVLDILDDDNLMNHAYKLGNYLMEELSKIDGIINVRGRGLMIGFEMTEALKDLKKQLLFDRKVFTGEAKPNIIRLLPSLSITKEQVDVFLQHVKELAAKV